MQLWSKFLQLVLLFLLLGLFVIAVARLMGCTSLLDLLALVGVAELILFAALRALPSRKA